MGEKKGFFKRLAEGLTKTRNNIVSGMDSIFKGFSSIDYVGYWNSRYEQYFGAAKGKSKRNKDKKSRRLQKALNGQHEGADVSTGRRL